MRIVHAGPVSRGAVSRGAVSRRAAAGVAAVGILLAGAACSSSSSSAASSVSGSSTINGAGSTFAAPMYQQWAGQYKSSHSVQINYQAIGSGGGISEFTQGVVNFGATDAPMTGTEQASAQAGQGTVVLHIPMIIGAIAIIYNEPSVQTLNLDGPALANIYLGAEPRGEPAIGRDPAGAAVRLVRHLLRLHVIPVRYLPDVGEPGWREQGAQLADGHRGHRQIGRGGRRPADQGRHRLCRVPLRHPGSHPVRVTEERIGPVRGSVHGLRERGVRGCHLPHDAGPADLQP